METCKCSGLDYDIDSEPKVAELSTSDQIRNTRTYLLSERYKGDGGYASLLDYTRFGTPNKKSLKAAGYEKIKLIYFGLEVLN
jgi:hypothetical protein